MPQNETKFKEFKLPAFYDSSDKYSIKWQSRFLKCQKIQLGSLMLAAFGGATAWSLASFRVSAFITVLALLAALGVRFYITKNQPERKWYNGRAAAESIKTLAMKYTQRAVPFQDMATGSKTDDLFIARLNEVMTTVPTLDEPVSLTNKLQITDDMRKLRAKTLAERKEYYIKLRIDDQVTWYSNKATFNSGRSNTWNVAIVVFETAAIIFAAMRLSGHLEFDTSGILATAAGAAIAWLQSRQHESLAQSYSVTSHELSAVSSVLNEVSSEKDWATKVEQAEEAISREHTLWKASHR